MGPTPALANYVLYHVNATEETSGFYMKQIGESSKESVPLFLSPEIIYDLKWMPDGSGFLFSKNYYRDNDSKLVSNIFRYDIATKKLTQITDLNDGYAREFSVSPSGNWIVYEKCAIDEDKSETLDFKTSDLWIISTNGKGDRLLVKNGMAPSWSR
jgi:Tol biopolymer transport system component